MKGEEESGCMKDSETCFGGVSVLDPIPIEKVSTKLAQLLEDPYQLKCLHM